MTIRDWCEKNGVSKNQYNYWNQRVRKSQKTGKETLACELFDELWRGEPVRHLGVRVSELCQNEFRQLSLFEKDYEKQRTVDRVVDSIRERYGNGLVFRSAFLNSGVRFSTGGTVDDEEYPMMSGIL
ncbi:hypothetical protein E4K67_11900 [Desulfosporosinus fructosivorans]|uniref:DNA polymerase Y-family little finger domain-containing protein n=2 Tax=Desulfosporosinus fructosivorans TaxID=2018669 RepID=A0A4Z0R9F7_9FIRM|nr:hypothetical protein [Desulfosporosinus fructosivorans]TGE38693.1 hypothetical protein E4K67_11900 [Desulfosporosinus fructosivorans]